MRAMIVSTHVTDLWPWYRQICSYSSHSSTRAMLLLTSSVCVACGPAALPTLPAELGCLVLLLLQSLLLPLLLPVLLLQILVSLNACWHHGAA